MKNRTIVTHKLFNGYNDSYMTIIEKETNKGIICSLMGYENELLLSMLEKKNGKGIKFDKSIKKMDYSQIIDMQLLLNFKKLDRESGLFEFDFFLNKVEGGFQF